MDLIRFEDTRRKQIEVYLATTEASPYLPALEQTASIIDGFESPLGMELLATTDWLVSVGGQTATVEGIRRGLREWPGGPTAARRKNKLFNDRLLSLALARLAERAPSTI